MNSDYDTKHIKVLDGIRALAILIIVWYHIWQQSWLIPRIGSFSLDFIPRYGFILVDMLILLSSFCLFIPYARRMVYKESIPDTKKFYIKRIAKIFPSYYIALLIAFIFLVFSSNFQFNGFFIKDTLMHLFFVQNWSLDTLISNNYMVVLWTVAIEVQFYLIFPFIAKRFMKKPVLTYIVMTIIGLVCIYVIGHSINNDNIGYYVNHFFTFIPVYANGMLAAWLYILFTKRKRTKLKDLIYTLISIMMIIGYYYICKSINDSNVMEWQFNNRILLSFIYMIFIISTCLSSKIYSKIFSNKLMKFIALISFNLYIYHQFIAVKLKEFKIPFFSGDELPNVLGNKEWQWKYTIICFIVAIVVAIIMTYSIERPISKFIRKKYKCDK